MTTVQLIEDDGLLLLAFAIRKEVFVEEQQVPQDEEYDQYEPTSRHFLALVDGFPAGTARWRYTEKGIKLERFAVRKEFRGKGVGKALVQAVLDDVAAQPESAGKLCYMHAQISAMPLYAPFGFQPEGEMFDECGIWHYKMVRKL